LDFGFPVAGGWSPSIASISPPSPFWARPLSQLHKCPLEKKNKRQYTRITYNTELLTILPTKEEMDSSYKITPKNGICAITQKKLCNQIGRENK